MNMLRRLAIFAIGLVCTSAAQADLVPFEIYGGNFDCFGGAFCDELSEVTGLDSNRLPFSVKFTIDTDAEELDPSVIPPHVDTATHDPDDFGFEATYLFSGQNTALEIILGDLVVDFTQFFIGISNFENYPLLGSETDVLEIWGDSNGTEFFFQLADHESSLFRDFTLRELVDIPLGGFAASSFNAASVSALLQPVPPVQGVQLLGGGNMLIRRVPEPGTLALLGIGFAGMGLSRRRKKV